MSDTELLEVRGSQSDRFIGEGQIGGEGIIQYLNALK